MLKLANDFYITSTQNNDSWKQSNLDREFTYDFRYKEFLIYLKISFEIIGYTKEDNIAIINFGYEVDIKRWLDRKQRFFYIADLDSINGKSTKKYLDSKDARELILRFIERTLAKYLKTVSPAIMIRGALNDIKTDLPRYKKFDILFFKFGYNKKEFDIKKYNSLYQISFDQQDDDKVFWVYCKNKNHFKQLKNVFK